MTISANESQSQHNIKTIILPADSRFESSSCRNVFAFQMAKINQSIYATVSRIAAIWHLLKAPCQKIIAHLKVDEQRYVDEDGQQGDWHDVHRQVLPSREAKRKRCRLKTLAIQAGPLARAFKMAEQA